MKLTSGQETRDMKQREKNLSSTDDIALGMVHVLKVSVLFTYRDSIFDIDIDDVSSHG